MRRAIFFCWSGCLLALFFAPGAWAQAEPCPVVVLSPFSLQLSEVSAPASALSTTQMDKAGIQVSPYQRWRQRYAPSDPLSSSLGSVPYRPAQQGSQRIQQGTERLPFWLEQSGIRLGEDSLFSYIPVGWSIGSPIEVFVSLFATGIPASPGRRAGSEKLSLTSLFSLLTISISNDSLPCGGEWR